MRLEQGTAGAQGIGPIPPGWPLTLLIEDNLSRSSRRTECHPGTDAPVEAFEVRLNRIQGGTASVCGRSRVTLGKDARWKEAQVRSALELLGQARFHSPGAVVLAGAEYGEDLRFLLGAADLGFPLAVDLAPSTPVLTFSEHVLLGMDFPVTVSSLVAGDSDWVPLQVVHPVSGQAVGYAACRMGRVRVRRGIDGWLIVLQEGAIMGLHRSTRFVFTTIPDVSLDALVQSAGWVRWIKPYHRQQKRPTHSSVAPASRHWSLGNRETPLISAAERTLSVGGLSVLVEPRTPTALPSSIVTVVELFAGAGGMGLGFLMAQHPTKRYRLLYSGEVHPVYARTLRRNHAELAARYPARVSALPAGETRPVDLREPAVAEEIAGRVHSAGGVDVVIGGPPCQGFSSANRNSWHGANPHNRLIDVYLEYIVRLQPKIFVMENVQGIVLSPKEGQSGDPLSVLDHFAEQMGRAGYQVYPKLVDAAQYGVPQRRTRCFIVGLRKDLGFAKGEFGVWGPFPDPTHGPGTGRRFVSVQDAIDGLPEIGNGETREAIPYAGPTVEDLGEDSFLRWVRDGAPAGTISDHVTSRHAPYVIERYSAIPPGGNWQDIADKLTNYANARRTHSNIYRRLDPVEPAITIGHYRKSMLVHPSQNRGLSLREATRLQSFPDWFRFAGLAEGADAGVVGLGHKQQQLANAVCPLVTKALAEFLLDL